MNLDIIAVKWNGKIKYLDSIAYFLFPFHICQNIDLFKSFLQNTDTVLFLFSVRHLGFFIAFFIFFVLIFPHIPLCPLKSLIALHFAVDCCFYRKLFISSWCIFSKKKKPCFFFFTWPWHCLLCLLNNLYLDFPLISLEKTSVISNKLLLLKSTI